MKKTLLGVLIVAMLFAMSPLLVFADSDQDIDQSPGSWGHYKTQHSSLVRLFEKVNPRHESYADFATEIKEVKLGIEAIFGKDGFGGLIGESAAAEADLVATDAEAEAYPVTSRDIHDVFTSAYNQLYVNSLGGITIESYSIGVQKGRVAQWNSIKNLWNAPVVSLVTGGGLDTPEQAVIDADATREIFVPYGECTNTSAAHRKVVFGFSAHKLGLGCTFENRIEIIPTVRALLLKSTGVVDIAKSYIVEQLEYTEAYANITEKNAAKIKSLAVNDDEKIIADEFIASAEKYAAQYKVLIPNAKSDLDAKISSLSSRLDAATKVTFPKDEPIVDSPTISTNESNIVKGETSAVNSNSLPEVGFVPGNIITEDLDPALIPAPTTPKSMGSPESTYSPLWIWGLTADLFAFVVVFLIILWRRKQRINAGEDIF